MVFDVVRAKEQLLMNTSVELDIKIVTWFTLIEIFSLCIDRMLESIIINLFMKKIKPSLLYIKIFFMM